MFEPIIWLRDWLLDNALARMFLVISLGYLLGEIRWPGGFRLGVAAVLFVGLAFGTWSPQMALPGELQTLGLILFVYCVGLQTAPGFFRCLKRDGLRLNLGVLLSLALGLGFCALAILWSGRSPLLLTGLFCGGLTNTPALGAATEALAKSGASPAEINLAVIGYGVAYPFAILTVLALMQLRVARGGADETAGDRVAALTPALTLEVETTDPAGPPWNAADVTQKTGLLLTRCQRPGAPMELVTENTPLPPGTRVVAVGSPEQLRRGLDLLGKVSARRLQDEMKGFALHRYFVSNPRLVGRPLGELGLEQLGAVVSRLRRGDVDLPVSDDTVLQLGDRVRVISYRDKEAAVRAFFGNSVTMLTELSYFSFGLGILLGLALGQVPLPVPGLSEPVRLGVAGGPLLIALVLGAAGRTGPFIWNLPLEVNLTLRNLGMLFFLACVGIKAGAGLTATLRADGLFLIGLTAGLVLVAHLCLWLCLHGFRRRDLATVLGAMSALQTQPAALTFAAARVAHGPLNTAYATVYPLAMVAKIIFAQVIIAVFR